MEDSVDLFSLLQLSDVLHERFHHLGTCTNMERSWTLSNNNLSKLLAAEGAAEVNTLSCAAATYYSFTSGVWPCYQHFSCLRSRGDDTVMTVGLLVPLMFSHPRGHFCTNVNTLGVTPANPLRCDHLERSRFEGDVHCGPKTSSWKMIFP